MTWQRGNGQGGWCFSPGLLWTEWGPGRGASKHPRGGPGMGRPPSRAALLRGAAWAAVRRGQDVTGWPWLPPPARNSPASTERAAFPARAPAPG